MTLALTLFLAIGVLGIQTATERRVAGAWATPFTLLAVPLTVVMILAAVLAGPLGFTRLNAPAALVLLLGLTLFWCGGLPVYAMLGATASRAEVHGETGWREPMLVISIALVVIMFLDFYQALSGINGIAELVTTDFQQRFSTGLTSIARPLAMLVVVYWIGIGKKASWSGRLAAAGLLVMLMASFVRGTMLLPLFGGLVYRAMAGRLRLSWHLLARIGLAGLAIVAAVFLAKSALLGLRNFGALELYARIGRNVLSYTLSGVLGFSQAWEQGMFSSQVEWRMIIAPAWNLYAHIVGLARVPNLSGHYMVIDLWASGISAESNVRTFFGTLIEFWGLVAGLGAAFVFGTVSALFHVAARRSGNCWLMVVFSLMAAAIFFGWFDYYFALNFWYIAGAFGFALALATEVRAWILRPVQLQVVKE